MSTIELFALLFFAQAGIPTEAEVRAEARRTLEPLCRGRCDVTDVEIRTRPEPSRGAVAPGFDDAPGIRRQLSEIRMTVLYDQKLDPGFRRFTTERVKERVGEFGVPVQVTPKVRPFPPPAEPLEPTPKSPEPVVESQNEAPEPPDWSQLALRRGLEFLPVFILFLLLGAILLLLLALVAWLVLRLQRRMEDLVFDLRPAPGESAAPLRPEVIEANGTPAARALPPPTVEELAEALHRHRSSTRRVFRSLLLSGEYTTVARAVALLGDGIVRDLARDPEAKPALIDAAQRTTEVLRTPMTDEERDAVLRIVQAELVADRVAYRGEDLRPELETLLGWSPEAFARFVDDLEDGRLVHLALRHAPAHLSEPYLRGLDEGARHDLVREVMEARPGTPEEVEHLGRQVEEQAVAAEVGGWEAEHLVDLLDALPADAQDHLLLRLERARPEFLRRNAGRLPVESVLLQVSDGALAAAWSEVPLEAWIAYLRGAPRDVRSRCLDACPPRLTDAVESELSLRVAVDAEAAREARKRVVRAALGAHQGIPALGPG